MFEKIKSFSEQIYSFYFKKTYIIMWLSGYTKILPECFTINENKFYVDNILDKYIKFKDDEAIKDFMRLVEK
ncbi:MAG: hypothetical protein IKF91_04230 [Bacilli bacterium]|nr:hypothetical protein [Bacilli bacterium]